MSLADSKTRSSVERESDARVRRAAGEGDAVDDIVSIDIIVASGGEARRAGLDGGRGAEEVAAEINTGGASLGIVLRSVPAVGAPEGEGAALRAAVSNGVDDGGAGGGEVANGLEVDGGVEVAEVDIWGRGASGVGDGGAETSRAANVVVAWGIRAAEGEGVREDVTRANQLGVGRIAVEVEVAVQGVVGDEVAVAAEGEVRATRSSRLEVLATTVVEEEILKKAWWGSKTNISELKATAIGGADNRYVNGSGGKCHHEDSQEKRLHLCADGC
jgi:hypothetical protein